MPVGPKIGGGGRHLHFAHPGPSQRVGHHLEHWRRLVRDGVVEGERHNAIASFGGHLLWHGIDPEVAMALVLCWNAVRCRPPLPADEVMRTVESITRWLERED